MSYSNDVIERAKRRLHDQTYDTTLDVLTATETATATGVESSYSTAETGIQARYEDPSADADRQESGTDVDLDAVYVVRDDTGVAWDDFGETGQAATRVDDTETGDRYEVQTVIDRRDGQLRLGCVEV